MSVGLKVHISGDGFIKKKLKKQSKNADKAANLSVHDTTVYGRKEAKKKILQQVNFSPSYLDGQSSQGRRLDTKFSKVNGLTSGIIVGRFRPTSLATFDAKQLTVPGKRKGKRKAGVTVNVRGRKRIGRGFMMALKNGNTGLAIRVDKGDKPNRRFNGKPLYKTQNSEVYLLYGPSVEQVFRSVAPEIAPDLSKNLNANFVRHYVRLNNAR